MGLKTGFCPIIILRYTFFFNICFMVHISCFVSFLFFHLQGGGQMLGGKFHYFFYPSLSASLIFRFQVMWFVQFACVFLLLILLCNLPFCLLPLHFSLLVDFAQKVDLALLVHFFSVVEHSYIIYLSWSEFCMIWVIWKLPVGFSTVPS